jgi:hypothetical protein
MPHLLIHHKVRDFGAWKAGYDAHKPARDAAGIRELHLLQGYEDPSSVVALFEAKDIEDIRAFAASPDLKKAMSRAGVMGTPVIIELQ